MQQPSFPTPPTRPIGWSGAAAMIAGAAMGAIVGWKVACAPGGWLLDVRGCAPGGAPAGALIGALLALRALPLLRQGTRRGEPAGFRPAPTTTAAARLMWLAIAAALGRWLAEGLLRRRGWARWAAVVVCSLLGVTALAGLVDWIGALVRERARGGWGPAPIDLITAVLFLAISVGVIVLLMTPATSRDFRSARRLAGSPQSL